MLDRFFSFSEKAAHGIINAFIIFVRYALQSRKLVFYLMRELDGLYIDRNDTIYVADSESESVAKNHDGWKRGIRIGSARDGSVTAFIPDPVAKATTTSAAEGVAVDAAGTIYGAEVGPKRLMKYVRE